MVTLQRVLLTQRSDLGGSITVTKRFVNSLFAGTEYRPLNVSYMVIASPDRISKYMRGDANASIMPFLKGD